MRTRGEARERLEDAAFDVVEVAHALAEIGVVHPLELAARPVDGLADGGLGDEAVLRDVALRLLHERRILEDHQVALEHAHVGAPGALAEN